MNLSNNSLNLLLTSGGSGFGAVWLLGA